MKLSHILIKVDNLEKAVLEWQNKGFVVEYGTSRNPYNALIYFKEGPFIELFAFKGFPSFLKPILNVFGMRHLVEKMDFWANHEEGLLSIMLENYEKDLSKEAEILKKYNFGGMISKKSRMDVKKRKLKFTVMFTDPVHFPDLMTFFSINPKPAENIHPNGVTGIKSISVGLSDVHKQAFVELCDDPRVEIFDGTGIKDLELL